MATEPGRAQDAELAASGIEFAASSIELAASGIEFAASGIEFAASGIEFAALDHPGAPIGGVLFSLEVTATYFYIPIYWKCFFTAVVGAVLSRLLYSWQDGMVKGAVLAGSQRAATGSSG